MLQVVHSAVREEGGIAGTASPSPRVDRRLIVWLYPAVLVAGAVALSALDLSGTSVGLLDQPGALATDPSLIVGAPRVVRGDEYAVATPYAVAQSELGYPRVSPSGIG